MARPTLDVHTAQRSLFDALEGLPRGLLLEPALIDTRTEAELVQLAAELPFRHARYHQYTARRRVHAWGNRPDDDAKPSVPMALLPPVLVGLRARLAEWAHVDPGEFIQVMMSEYRPGTPLGWHRDAPHYGLIAGVSIASAATLRLRPWATESKPSSAMVTLELAPRSAYVLSGEARWAWQHDVLPVRDLRYSVTMRTARP